MARLWVLLRNALENMELNATKDLPRMKGDPH